MIKIDGEGMPIRGELGSYGDLLAKVAVNFPRTYTASQLEQIRKIFEASPNI